MTPQARLQAVDSGLTPAGDGWFVVNVDEAAWLANEHFGARCVFEADARVARTRDDLDVRRFPDVGYTLSVLAPGQPSGLYHAESTQEGFLVLSGECVLLVEGEERPLRAWDFFHCPPGTEHAFVGAGDGPCVILMIGGRTTPRTILYPSSEMARRHGAGAERETSSAAEAYSPFPHWTLGRPAEDGLPWAQRSQATGP
jgi:uncharacterized cupin superfamily protein